MSQTRNIEGKSQSAVRVVVYEDLQCSDCANFRLMLDAHLIPKYGSKVAFEHRDFPLAKHAWARKAAIAARYFDSVKPETGTRFRQATMAQMREIPADKFNDHVAAFAKANGADPDKAVAALNDPKLQAVVEEDYQEGVARGIAKTPTVFVNGEAFVETFPLEEISKSIEAAVKEAGQ